MERQRPHPVVMAEQCLEEGAPRVPESHGLVAGAGCDEFGGRGGRWGLFETSDGGEVGVGGGWGKDAAFDYVFVAEKRGFVFGG